MIKLTNIETKLTTFIERYMTEAEFFTYSFYLLLLVCVIMISYIVYKIIVNEKAGKALRKTMKKGDTVIAHGIIRPCRIHEINDDGTVTVTITVKKEHIYPK